MAKVELSRAGRTSYRDVRFFPRRRAILPTASRDGTMRDRILQFHRSEPQSFFFSLRSRRGCQARQCLLESNLDIRIC